jgi:DNA-binding CsgD family transcriptional regulator
MVLRRDRDQAEGSLFVTGRDVDEAELAVTLDPAAGGWLLATTSPVAAVTTRERITAWVRDNPGSTPAQIAVGLNLDRGAVKQSCRRLAKDGTLSDTLAGGYHEKRVTVSPKLP